MKIFSSDNSELMRVDAVERSGNQLIIRGKVFGSMPMTAKIRPGEARKALRLLSFGLVVFLITFLFRSDD